MTLGKIRIPFRAEIKVLGLRIQKYGKYYATYQQLLKQGNQITPVIKSITSYNTGLKEKEALRLRDAFIISRFRYPLPYLNPSKAEKLKLEALIRKANKVTLVVPISTSNKALLETDTHKTTDEII